MLSKPLLSRQRLRRAPSQFSWIDHRFVRHDYVRRCDCRSLALYLVLVTVADAQGLSYYSDSKLAEMLSLSLEELTQARQRLLAASLIAYQPPFYQVLALDEAVSSGGVR